VQKRVQRSSPPTTRLPYVVLRGVNRRPTYKRRIPPDLRSAIGTTITAALAGSPHGGLAERQQFLASYSRAHQQAEQRLAQARGGLRQLSAIEQLGVAGAWARQAGPMGSNTVAANEAAAVLRALVQLSLVLPPLIGGDWSAAGAHGHPRLQEVVQELAHELHHLDHPGLAPQPDGALLWDAASIPTGVLVSYLQACVQAAAPELALWLQRAQHQLDLLGLVVSPEQRQQVALRMATAATALGRQEQQIEAGRIVPPLNFPEPPKGSSGAALALGDALTRWRSLRDPAPKTWLDAERRIGELAAFLGHDRLDLLTAEQVAAWRAQLIETCTATTVKRKLGLVRAVLQAAAAEGLPIPQDVLDRLSAKGLRESGGTRRQRRPFSLEEAQALWQVSREQQGSRPLDRWALPLGLALGARLEELAGLTREDVREVDGVWVVEIQPSTDRRLKSDSSARRVPIPTALQAEGFLIWVQMQDSGLLFPEPPPPAADPRRSHYASVRLGKLIRQQAGISDPTAVFHSARHFVAQSLVDAGVEQRLIEQLLGHSSRSMTARYSRGGVPLVQLAAAMERRDWGWVPAEMAAAA
jgi:integrase